MNELSTVTDKQEKERERHPVAVTAALLAAISLTFAAINLHGCLPIVFSGGNVGAVMLACEAGAELSSYQSSAPRQSEPVPTEPPPPSETSPLPTESMTLTPQTEELFPPAAANSPVPDTALTPAEPNSAEKVITTVIQGGPNQGYLEFGDIYIKNNTSYSPDLEALLNAPLELEASPTVLIIHTHATECYTPTELDSYPVETGDRCFDPEYSVVRVGEELANALRNKGIRVIHDRTLFDAASYTGAYAGSNAAVKSWLEKDPTISVVLDIHRDALNEEGSTRYRLAVDSPYGEAAQMLILVGTDAGGANHPYWQKNLSLALKLQNGLNTVCPRITRPMLLTNSSYNQEAAPGALLIEMGANGNSLSDALNSAKLLGEVLGDILG